MQKKQMRIVALTCVVFILALAQGSVCLAAETSSGAAGFVPLYMSMTELFANGEYNDAYEIALEIEKIGGSSYKDASLYLLYLKGWQAVREDDIDRAINYFKPLVAAEFENANGFYSYLMGRKQQEIGSYNEAIEYYDAAAQAGVYDGVSYRVECEYAMLTEDYAAAVRLEQQGNYLLAAQTFESLDTYSDSYLRAKECYYLYAESLEAGKEYAQAMSIYIDLGTYKDSADRAHTCFTIVNSATPDELLANLVCEEATVSTLSLSWTDALDSGAYTVTWYPGLMAHHAVSTKLTTCAATLSDLIPATKYTVLITIADDESSTLTGSFYTEQAPIQADIDIKMQQILAFEQRSLIGRDLKALQDWEIAKGLTDNTIYTPSSRLRDAGVGYMVSDLIRRNESEEDEVYECMCVLRVGEEYVAVGTSQYTLSGALRFPSLYLEITDLLDDIYLAAGGWPNCPAVLDMYINSCWVERTDFILAPESK